MKSRMIDSQVESAVMRIGAMPLLILFALAMLLPGLVTLPPVDRDEPRFAQASKQMLETGNFVDIRFGDTARNKKPVGIHWLQAVALRLGEDAGVADARHQIWLYRLPSLFGAIATILLTAWAAAPFVSRRGCVLAGLLLAATPLLGVEARLATTDAVLAATVAASMGALGRLYLQSRRNAAWAPAAPRGIELAAIFWIALGIGILVKGPITPLIPAFAALLLSLKQRSARWLRALRPIAGLLVCLCIVLPWFVLIILHTHGGFVTEAVGQDLLSKVAGAQELHGAPPGAYFAAFWLTGWPMAPFLALVAAALWRHRGDDRVVFLLAWIGPGWLLFEAVPTKLFHYVLPLYPALAILTVLGLEQARRDGRLAWRAGRPVRGGRMVFALLALVPLGVLILVFAGNGRVWTLDPRLAVVGVAATLLSLFLAWSACRALTGTLFGAGALAALASMPVQAFVFGLVLTSTTAPDLAVSPRLAEAARLALSPDCADPLYATAGDREPSLMFMTDSRLLMTDGAGAARFLAEGPCRIAFVAMQDAAAFDATLAPTVPVALAARIGGIAINGGKPLDIGVYVRQGTPP